MDTPRVRAFRETVQGVARAFHYLGKPRLLGCARVCVPRAAGEEEGGAPPSFISVTRATVQ